LSASVLYVHYVEPISRPTVVVAAADPENEFIRDDNFGCVE